MRSDRVLTGRRGVRERRQEEATAKRMKRKRERAGCGTGRKLRCSVSPGALSPDLSARRFGEPAVGEPAVRTDILIFAPLLHLFCARLHAHALGGVLKVFLTVVL